MYFLLLKSRFDFLMGSNTGTKEAKNNNAFFVVVVLFSKICHREQAS